MPAKDSTTGALPDILILEKPQDIKLIFSEKHNLVLKQVIEKEQSISDIARVLDMNPGSVHYYLKELEKHGLVKQVRDEIKGGVVKKYYRSAARRILMDTPDFNRQDIAMPDAEMTQHLLKSVEFLGYHVEPGNLDDAKDLLQRYNKRLNELVVELDNAGLREVEENGLAIQSAYGLVLNLRAREDPEMGRIYNEFEKLFLKYE